MNAQTNSKLQFGSEVALIASLVEIGKDHGAGLDFWSWLKSNGHLFPELIAIMEGKATIDHHNHIFKTQKPEGNDNQLRVVRHHSHGYLLWNPEKVLLLQNSTKVGTSRHLNYNVLRNLQRKPFLIPKNWYGQSILFKGTTFENRDKEQYWSEMLVSTSGNPAIFMVSTTVCSDNEYAEAVFSLT